MIDKVRIGEAETTGQLMETPSYVREDVSLTDLSVDCAPAMYRWVCDPEVRENIGLRDEPSLAKTVAWIESRLDDPSTRPFAILCNGEHVGNVVLDRMDKLLRSARLSLYIGGASNHGQGIGTAAVWLALREAFIKLRLHKVWLTVHAQNSRAITIYIRHGFVIEGVLRDEFVLDNRRLAVFYMGILDSEFLGQQEQCE